jgi:sulfate/thiosulfate transport system ATP-binding protein
LMNKGKVEQVGTPNEVYEKPATPFVYGFLGSVNLFQGRVQGNQLQIGEHSLGLDAHSLSPNTPVIAYARPHELDVVRPDGQDNGIPAQIKRVLAFGSVVRLELESDDGKNAQIEAELTRERYGQLGLAEGASVVVRARSTRVFVDHEAEVAA